MRSLDVTKEAVGFIRALKPKQFKQVMSNVLDLMVDLKPADTSTLKVYTDLFRVDIGEYRIVYRCDDNFSIFPDRR